MKLNFDDETGPSEQPPTDPAELIKWLQKSSAPSASPEDINFVVEQQESFKKEEALRQDNKAKFEGIVQQIREHEITCADFSNINIGEPKNKGFIYRAMEELAVALKDSTITELNLTNCGITIDLAKREAEHELLSAVGTIPTLTTLNISGNTLDNPMAIHTLRTGNHLPTSLPKGLTTSKNIVYIIPSVFGELGSHCNQNKKIALGLIKEIQEKPASLPAAVIEDIKVRTPAIVAVAERELKPPMSKEGITAMLEYAQSIPASVAQVSTTAEPPARTGWRKFFGGDNHKPTSSGSILGLTGNSTESDISR